MPRGRVSVVLCSLAIVVALCLAHVASPHAQTAPAPNSARIYITVIGADGHPVQDLGPADFGIRENGVVKSVVRAEPTTDPLAVELITDRLGGTYSPDQMRGALATVIDTILSVIPKSRIGLMTFDGASTVQHGFTSNQGELMGEVNRYFSNNSSVVLLEGITDASRLLMNEPEGRRAVVALVSEYRADTSGLSARTAAEALRDAKASLWMLEAHAGAGAAPNRNRDAMSTMATHDSGGSAASVSSPTALVAAATKLAALMLAQYAVTYENPSPLKDVRLDVAVNRPNVHLYAPHWTAGGSLDASSR